MNMFYLGLFAVRAALAADPEPSEPTFGADTSVTSQVTIPADPARVRAALADPVTAARLCPDIISARVLEHSTCDLVEVTTRGLSDPLIYKVRRCPNGSGGYSETLVSSDDFSQVRVEWKLAAVQGGTQVTYTILTDPNLPVPQRLISLATARSAVTTLKNLVHRIIGP
jgi:hypothetical protein